MKKVFLFTFVVLISILLSLNFIYANEIYANENDIENSIINIEKLSEENKNIELQHETEQEQVEDIKIDNTVSNEQTIEVKNDDIKNDIKDINSNKELLRAKKLEAIKSFIKTKNNKLSAKTISNVAEAALNASEKNQFDVTLILAVMWKESTFNPEVYNTNCYGVMQIHKNTASGFGYKIKDIKDPYKAALLGSKILKGHIKNYNSAVMGLTAYNQGTGNVKKGNYNTRYANNVLQKQKTIKAYIDNSMK